MTTPEIRDIQDRVDAIYDEMQAIRLRISRRGRGGEERRGEHIGVSPLPSSL